MTVGVFACLQVDNDRRDLDMNSKDVDAEKMTRFIRMNELRLVTDYNPVVITSSPQSSPGHLASSSWVSSGPRVCMPRCVPVLWQWCGWGWGGHKLFAATPCGEWKQMLHWSMQVGWGEEWRHGSSFTLPINLGCWWAGSSTSYHS